MNRRFLNFYVKDTPPSGQLSKISIEYKNRRVRPSYNHHLLRSWTLHKKPFETMQIRLNTKSNSKCYTCKRKKPNRWNFYLQIADDFCNGWLLTLKSSSLTCMSWWASARGGKVKIDGQEAHTMSWSSTTKL